MTLSALDDPTKYEKNVLSQVATNMKTDIEESVVDCDHDNMLLQTSQEKFDMRKDWSQILDGILTDERGSKEMKQKVDDGLRKVAQEYYMSVAKIWGNNGGGDGKTEFMGGTCDGSVEARLKGFLG